MICPFGRVKFLPGGGPCVPDGGTCPSSPSVWILTGGLMALSSPEERLAVWPSLGSSTTSLVETLATPPLLVRGLPLCLGAGVPMAVALVLVDLLVLAITEENGTFCKGSHRRRQNVEGVTPQLLRF